MSFGMGGSVSTSSGVAQRAESEARQKEDRYTQRAESIPTGMGAIPGIAQGAAPTLGQVVKEADNLGSSDTLGQVLQEASQTGLLSDTESTLIGNQLGSPEGNERASTMLRTTLPLRRADQKAIEFINSMKSDKILEIKNIQDPSLRQEKINTLVQDIQLEAAKSEDEVTRTAIMKRVKDMFGIQSGGSDAYNLAHQKHLWGMERDAARIAGYEGLDIGKDERKKDFLIKHKTPHNGYTKARDTLTKTTEGTGSLKAIHKMFDEYTDENGEYDLIGFSKEYFGDIAKLTEQAKEKNQSPEFKKALKQQQEFMTFLTAHLKAMSGTAVTRSEAVKVLIAFGLGDYADELSPDTSPREFENATEKFVTKLFKNRYSTLTPQKIIDGLNALSTIEQEKVNNIRNNYMVGLEGTEFAPLLEKQLNNVQTPRFKNANTRYDAKQIPDASKLREAVKKGGGEFYEGVGKFVFGEDGKTKKTTGGSTQQKTDPTPKVDEVEVNDIPTLGDSVTYTPKEIDELDWSLGNE